MSSTKPLAPQRRQLRLVGRTTPQPEFLVVGDPLLGLRRSHLHGGPRNQGGRDGNTAEEAETHSQNVLTLDQDEKFLKLINYMFLAYPDCLLGTVPKTPKQLETAAALEHSKRWQVSRIDRLCTST